MYSGSDESLMQDYNDALEDFRYQLFVTMIEIIKVKNMAKAATQIQIDKQRLEEIREERATILE